MGARRAACRSGPLERDSDPGIENRAATDTLRRHKGIAGGCWHSPIYGEVAPPAWTKLITMLPLERYDIPTSGRRRSPRASEAYQTYDD